MDSHFVKISDSESFEELLSRSKEQPIVIFKHSTTCAISAGAYEEMARWKGAVVLVEVQNARALSREIEHRTGVAHESPQVIVLRNGRVVWDASHWRVKAESVAEAVRKAEGQQQDSRQEVG